MLRLIDEARLGAMSGDASKMVDGLAPAVRFWAPIVALLGPTALTPGDWTDEDVTKMVLGKASKVPGFLEMLFGVSLQHQLGLGSIGLEDINSFMFYMPGPSVGFAQALIGGLSGVSAGQGANLSQLGRRLTADERFRLIVQSFPGGVQANRVLQALRLLQTDGRYKKSLDISEFLGVESPSGDLLSGHTASTEQILAQAIGAPSAEKERERTRLNRQYGIEREHDAIVAKAGSYMVAGRPDKAREELAKFVGKYRDDEFVGNIDPMSLLTERSIDAAWKRQILPPGKRKLAPEWARPWRSFTTPPRSIFDEETK